MPPARALMQVFQGAPHREHFSGCVVDGNAPIRHVDRVQQDLRDILHMLPVDDVVPIGRQRCSARPGSLSRTSGSRRGGRAVCQGRIPGEAEADAVQPVTLAIEAHRAAHWRISSVRTSVAGQCGASSPTVCSMPPCRSGGPKTLVALAKIGLLTPNSRLALGTATWLPVIPTK